MSNIKKYDENLKKWVVVSSDAATGIKTTNTKLLNSDETVISVDKALERLRDDMTTAQKNISWLALHGGGGSGGGGGSSTTEATCVITVNDLATGGAVAMDNSGLRITLGSQSSSATKNWNITVRIGSYQVATGTASFTNSTFYVAATKITPYLNNHTGTLSVSASYEDEEKGVYGSSAWSGSVLESVVNLTVSNMDSSIDEMNTKQIVYNYSVGIAGAYKLLLSIKKQGQTTSTSKEYDVTISDTTAQTKAITISDLIEQNPSSIGVYTITATLQYQSNTLIYNTVVSTVTIASTDILISTTKMSTDSAAPTEVSLDGSLNLVFTAYVQQAKSFTYDVAIDGTVVKSKTVGYFGEEVSDYISVSNKSWAVEGATSKVTLTVTSGDKSATAEYYVKFVKASDTYLTMSANATNHMVSEFLTRNYNAGDSSFSLQNAKYQNGGATYPITSLLKTVNGNSLSTITILSSGQPYLRLSNEATAKLNGWTFGGKTYTLPNLLTTKQFTISMCFKADYHADDNRTILYCGNLDASTGEISTGISVDVHDIYINNESVAKLTDNTINNVDITCTQTTTETLNDKGETVEVTSYIIKVYLAGVLTATRQLSSFISLGDTIYLGCRTYTVGTEQKYIYLCDCNLYNMQIYDTPLSDYDIATNYINNKVSTTYVSGSPTFTIIDSELKKNFCERNADGTVLSHLYTDSGYSIDFLLGADGKLSQDNLNSYAKSLGIPIVLLDVSTDPNWTFNSFVTQQTSGQVSLPASSGKTIQYWDPNGSNNNVLSILNCSIELQGTSTLADFVKNLNITVPDTTAFIPKKTWFPEQTYTLKADIVDSSHSNNAAIGTFINTELGYDESSSSSYYPFDKNAISNVYDADYKKNQQTGVTLKHTVEGFPVLVIIKFYVSETSKVSVTPLGIYSFNLGRNAYRNLGFKKLTKITDSAKDTPVITNFPYLMEDATYDESNGDANWIEISDTISLADMVDFTDTLPANFDSAKGDFWQNDTSILDARYEVRFPQNKKPSDYTNFKTFVGNIMMLPIEGTYSTDSLGNVTKPQVSGSYNLYKCDASNNYILTGATQTMVTDSNVLPDNLGFNSESFYKYFVVGNLFGLIDNFGKNTTYRSWLNGNYYIDFYDLDSAMGGDNQGGLTVGADVWMKYLMNNIQTGHSYGYVGETYNSSKAISKSAISANHNKLWISLDTPLYRSKEGITVNSTYTKYWYDLRNKLDDKAIKANYNSFVDYFMGEYYTKQTGDCGPLLFNYDYKLKYLLQFTDDTYKDTKALTKLHGRKQAYTRDWLKKHILFLDSVFYWRDPSQTMNFKNNLNTRGYNSVLNTVDAFPMKSNIPMIMYHSVGDTTKTYYFMQQNTETYVNAGSNASDSVLNWNFSNSPNIINWGNDSVKLKDMNVAVLSNQVNANTLDYDGYPSITDLDLSQNDSFQAFSMKSFEYGPISEIRTLDFSNTSGSSFALNLKYLLTDGSYGTKYTKLSKIDISNSTCISNLTIPSIPLKELIVRNSNITEFVLENQAYISNVDLTGCNKVTKITIKGCDSYQSLDISSLTNLKEVDILNCSNITSIKIASCANLNIVAISNCPKLTSIQITNCVGLVGGTDTNYLSITDCSALTSLNLSSCLALKAIDISQSNQANITYLNLASTSMSKVTGDGANTSLLDLSNFQKLTYFNISGNSTVTAIQFYNSQSNPVPLTNTFQGCTSLTRVYGNVNVMCTGIFRGCSVFSIHGSSTGSVTFNGNSVLNNGRVMMPYEVQNANYVGKAPYSDFTIAFQSGTGVTNMQFGLTNLNEDFFGTDCSTFDIYYVTSSATNAVSFQSTFWSLKQNPFWWTSSVDNSPNRYMFVQCPKVVHTDDMFHAEPNTSGRPFYIRLFSPTVESGAITQNDGLFSPLVNTLASMSQMFSGYTFLMDKYLFRHSTSSYNQLSNMLYFSPSLLINGINSRGYIDISSISSITGAGVTLSDCGDFTEFFSNLPALSVGVGMFNGCIYINYSTITNIPTYCTYLLYCFNSNYGSGTITPSKFFSTPANVQTIKCSFRVSDATAGQVNMPIDNTTLSAFTNLRYIGYNEGSEYGYGANGPMASSFNGAGINKTITGTFPFDILSSCKTKIIMFAGFFMGCTAIAALTETPAFPGTLFTGASALQNCAATFHNIGFKYTLVGDGFSSSSNLTTVAYLFSSDSNRENFLSGSIPNRLFYHGETNISKTYLGIADGTVTSENGVDDNGVSFVKYTIVIGSNTYYMVYKNGVTTWTDSTGTAITPLGTVYTSTTVTYKKPLATIASIANCFQGANIQPYECTSPVAENNEYYQPYKWVYADNSWKAVTQNTYLTTQIWQYDGVNGKVNGVENLDDANDGTVCTYLDFGSGTTKSGTLLYCCAPDLLRYCNPSNAVVTGLFSYCGHDVQSSAYGHDFSKNDYGLHGRIPPYLLYPLKSSTGLSLDSMFINCRNISYYTQGGRSYVIPKTFFNYCPNITSMVYTFSGFSFPQTIDLNVFSYITASKLGNINHIFYMPNFTGTSTSPCDVSNVFSTFRGLTNTAYAFATTYNENNQSVKIVNQYVKFSNVFPTGVYNNATSYGSNQNFAYTFAYYTSGYVTHEAIKTLVDNTTTNNYKYYG